jgi:hypothetical protein
MLHAASVTRPAVPSAASSDQLISLDTLSEKTYNSITDVLIAMGLMDQVQASKLLVDTVSAGKSVEKLIEEQNCFRGGISTSSICVSTFLL